MFSVGLEITIGGPPGTALRAAAAVIEPTTPRKTLATARRSFAAPLDPVELDGPDAPAPLLVDGMLHSPLSRVAVVSKLIKVGSKLLAQLTL